MGASLFQFKQFIINQEHCSMKVTTDSCLFGAWVADRIKDDVFVKNILDIGSGTGLLSLMLAQQTAASIDAIELQEKDYLQSLENVAASPCKERINITYADATKHPFNKKYDVIISNPPFYENDLKGDIASKNIAHHDDGLTLQHLLKIISHNLSETGKFYLLLPYKRQMNLLKTIENTGLFINCITSVHQTEKHDVFRMMVEGSFQKTLTNGEKIIIKENDMYSDGFIRLLQPYYLKL